MRRIVVVFIHYLLYCTFANILNSTLNDLRDHQLSCYRTAPGRTQPLVEVQFHVCYQVVKFLLLHERIDLPLDFSRRDSAGYPVPAQWKAGNCVIKIDVPDYNQVQTATFADIAREAGLVLLGCVIQPPHYGGTTFVGSKLVMNVSVFGVARGAPSLSSPTLSIGNASRADEEGITAA